MYYNQLGEWQEIPMPLLMGFTPPEKIQDAGFETPVAYDPVFQIVYDMRTIGTRSLKYGVTRKKRPNGSTESDNANEIDDSKTVK
jgi:hypothetical protein